MFRLEPARENHSGFQRADANRHENHFLARRFEKERPFFIAGYNQLVKASQGLIHSNECKSG
ncbi:MAG: hypothetical protein ACJ75H_16610, partial [Thermoanaerobaculia bacterium]